MKPIIKVENVFVGYDKTVALTNINLTINKGDYIGIVGPNGSGKTTLIKAILGLLPIQNGSINILSEKEKFLIGYVQQKIQGNENIFPATVKEIVLLGTLSKKKNLRIFNHADFEAVELILKKLHILELQNKRINQLSGGEYQRVLLARALVNNPDLLILDEPTSALDPNMREDLFSLLDELNQKQNTTILFVSHDISAVGKFTKKILYLDKNVIFFGTFEDFCKSKDMTRYFGFNTQHQFCWRHVNE